MEWWDSVILIDNLDTILNGEIAIKKSAINTLVEHPTQMRCPSKYEKLCIVCRFRQICLSPVTYE